jgi:hypothetical protein
MVHIIAALIYYWIDLKKLWLDHLDKVVKNCSCGCSSSSKSWFDKRRFQHNEPAKSLVKKKNVEQASQSTRQEVTN